MKFTPHYSTKRWGDVKSKVECFLGGSRPGSVSKELLDEAARRFELGLCAAWRMYPDWGEVPVAGVAAVRGGNGSTPRVNRRTTWRWR